jgi:genome maintenance exonuclease 1
VENLPKLQSLETKEINGKRHYLLPSGKYVPSVTTMLGYFKAQSIQQWRNRVGHQEANRISNRASTRGTKFHNLLEKYLNNSPITSILTENVMPDMKQAFWDIESTLDRIDNIHYLETPLYSEKMKLAGRTDAIGEFDGTLSVIDFKTSSKPKSESIIEDYFLQGTAYALMYEERVGNPIDQVVVIISTDGLKEPQLFVKNKDEYENKLFDKILKYHQENKGLIS